MTIVPNIFAKELTDQYFSDNKMTAIKIRYTKNSPSKPKPSQQYFAAYLPRIAGHWLITEASEKRKQYIFLMLKVLISFLYLLVLCIKRGIENLFIRTGNKLSFIFEFINIVLFTFHLTPYTIVKTN